MLSAKKLLLVAGCAALALSLVVGRVSAGEPEPEREPENSEFAVDFTTSDGLHIQFPYYGQLRTLEPKLNEITKESVINIMNYIQEVMGKSLEGKRVHALGWTGVTAKLISIAKKSLSARKGMRAGTGGQFNSDMNIMFANMMQKRNQVEVAKEDPLELKRDISVLFEALKEAVVLSPTASYFDWSKGLINGESFVDVSAGFMARLSKQGYGSFLNCISSMLALLVKWTY